MKLFTKHEVHTNGCEEVVVLAYRDEDGNDGVLITSWHFVEGDYLFHSAFIEMDFDFISSFLNGFDYSAAEAFANKFEA